MKKIVLSLAGVLAATAFAPEAAAIPSFARQTGMACSACHFQHFPILNSFGQAFKSSGYTMMGAQGKVEGEHLSIPDTLNASMLLKAMYIKDNRTVPAGAISGTNRGTGIWRLPDELSLFFGGRVAENIGFMFEGNTTAANLVAGFKMPVVFDLGGAKLMAIPYTTDGLGASYGYEQSSTGAGRGVRWAENRTMISAHQFVGVGAGAATGLAFVVKNDMGYINFSRYSPSFASLDGAGAVQYKSNYLRIAATPSVSDWNMHIGAQILSGDNYVAAVGVAPIAANLQTQKGHSIDFQAQTQAAGKDLSVYAAYAKAPVVAAVVGGTAGNTFCVACANDRKAWNIGADYSVIQSVLHLGASYRGGKTGGGLAGANLSDNSTTLTAVYDLAQNVALHFNYSHLSGSNRGGVTGNSTNEWLTMLEAAW